MNFDWSVGDRSWDDLEFWFGRDFGAPELDVERHPDRLFSRGKGGESRGARQRRFQGSAVHLNSNMIQKTFIILSFY